jgi:predicted Zn-dependent protease
MNLAWTFLEQGKTADAILLAKELADAHPMAEAPWNLQMLAAEQQGKSEEAFYLLQESLQRYPEQPILWAHLAEILEKQGQKAEAARAKARSEVLGGLR